MPAASALAGDLEQVVGPERVLVEPEDVIPFSFDGTAGLRQLPAAVVFPRTTAEVAGCVRAAADRFTPIVTRGSGTGLSGGSVPTPGAIVLCLARMNGILAVDSRNLLLRAPAGAITQDIDQAAAAHGLLYPPDPCPKVPICRSKAVAIAAMNVTMVASSLRGTVTSSRMVVGRCRASAAKALRRAEASARLWASVAAVRTSRAPCAAAMAAICPASSATAAGCSSVSMRRSAAPSQRVTTQPRSLLRSLPGVSLVDLKESSWCCGAAGVYAATQPAQADALLERKVGHLRSTGAAVVASANPGCQLQLERGLRERAASMHVVHPISLLADAYRRESTGGAQ